VNTLDNSSENQFLMIYIFNHEINRPAAEQVWVYCVAESGLHASNVRTSQSRHTMKYNKRNGFRYVQLIAGGRPIHYLFKPQ
jgi:hypothetical protein